MATVELRHDGMARCTLYRCTTYPINNECKWCGQKGKRLYLYYWRNDDRMRPVTPLDIGRNAGPFCNINCWESYNG